MNEAAAWASVLLLVLFVECILALAVLSKSLRGDFYSWWLFSWFHLFAINIYLLLFMNRFSLVSVFEALVCAPVIGVAFAVQQLVIIASFAFALSNSSSNLKKTNLKALMFVMLYVACLSSVISWLTNE